MFGTHCLKCGYVRMPMEGEGEACPRCEAAYTEPSPPREAPKPIAAVKTAVQRAREAGAWAELPPDDQLREARRLVVSTTDLAPGRQITQSVDLVSACYTYAFGTLSETVSGLARDLAGSGASPKTEAHILGGTAHVIDVLRLQALHLGAHAVVGIRFHFTEFSGANERGVVAVVANGTAVLLEPEE